VDGFAGSHLSELLLRQRYRVHGTTRRAVPDPSAQLRPEVVCHPVDLVDREAVRSVVDRVRPAWVFHLAALSSPAASWDDPAGTISNNVGGQANLLDALVLLEPKPRVLVVGSTDEYGSVPGRGRRLNEGTPLRPLSPYAVSKVAQDYLGLQYYLSRNLPCVRVRPFNHAGPRQSPHFAVASFAQQIARIELGLQPPRLKVGNLKSKRDFTDVRDMARAYLLALTRGKPGEVYNLGSGRAVELAQIVRALVRLSKTRISIEPDPDRSRVAEAPVYLCDPRRFQRLTGWKPAISLDRTLRDTLTYWRRCEGGSPN
jgi:GDP-4-dehydro-6-deoxy-D-mannose reductase